MCPTTTRSRREATKPPTTKRFVVPLLLACKTAFICTISSGATVSSSTYTSTHFPHYVWRRSTNSPQSPTPAPTSAVAMIRRRRRPSAWRRRLRRVGLPATTNGSVGVWASRNPVRSRCGVAACAVPEHSPVTLTPTHTYSATHTHTKHYSQI